jgi:hypothetical protein
MKSTNVCSIGELPGEAAVVAYSNKLSRQFWSLWLPVRILFGDGTLLYKDVGVDSINIYYPRYVLVSDYIRDEGIPSWSFRVGMGQNIFSSLSALLISPVVWLAKGAIARALVYQHLLYVLLSGLLFALFLANRGLTFASCLLGALLLSFSAYMCMGSCWYFQPTKWSVLPSFCSRPNKVQVADDGFTSCRR